MRRPDSVHGSERTASSSLRVAEPQTEVDLIPPTDTPKPRLRALVKAVVVGAIVGAAYGALAGYFTGDPELVVYAGIGGAFAGFLLWTRAPNVLWGRDK